MCDFDCHRSIFCRLEYYMVGMDQLTRAPRLKVSIPFEPDRRLVLS